MWHHWWITGPYIFPQSLICEIYAKILQHILPAIPLQEGSTVNMTSDVLPAWCTVHSFQSDCHAISESATYWSWCWAELATMVNVHDSVRLTCMGDTWTPWCMHSDFSVMQGTWTTLHCFIWLNISSPNGSEKYPNRCRPHWTTNQ